MVDRFRRALVLFVLLISVDVVFPQKAHAYLDPGTGSYVAQLVVAALLAGAVTVKMHWSRIKSRIVGLFTRKKGHGEDSN